MRHEKLVFNESGNLLANHTVNICFNGVVTDFSPLVSDAVGAVVFDAPEGEYTVGKYEQPSIGEQDAQGNEGGSVLPEAEGEQGESISGSDLPISDETIPSNG